MPGDVVALDETETTLKELLGVMDADISVRYPTISKVYIFRMVVLN